MRTKTSIFFNTSPFTISCFGSPKISSPLPQPSHQPLHLFFSIGSNMRNILDVTFGRVVVV